MIVSADIKCTCDSDRGRDFARLVVLGGLCHSVQGQLLEFFSSRCADRRPTFALKRLPFFRLHVRICEEAGSVVFVAALWESEQGLPLLHLTVADSAQLGQGRLQLNLLASLLFLFLVIHLHLSIKLYLFLIVFRLSIVIIVTSFLVMLRSGATFNFSVLPRSGATFQLVAVKVR